MAARYVAVPLDAEAAAKFLAHYDVEFGGLDVAMAAVDTEMSRIVAVAVFNNFDAKNIELSVYTDSPQPLTRRVLRAVFDYPFNQLGCERVTARTGARRKDVRAMIRRLGFKPEGKLRRYFEDDDAMIYGLLKTECRWIKNG